MQQEARAICSSLERLTSSAGHTRTSIHVAVPHHAAAAKIRDASPTTPYGAADEPSTHMASAHMGQVDIVSFAILTSMPKTTRATHVEMANHGVIPSRTTKARVREAEPTMPYGMVDTPHVHMASARREQADVVSFATFTNMSKTILVTARSGPSMRLTMEGSLRLLPRHPMPMAQHPPVAWHTES